ncbi:MAG: hypothetical protein K0S74_884 [Chlamydiales bacterium]|jgi:TrmH family RNA methyltransferase|nr:hypothetical protein [Chlamydiales bacterium]
MQATKLSKETNEIQRVVTLRNSRNKRHQYREFIIEGNIAIDEAYKKGWKIKSLFYNREIQLSQWTKTHLANKKYDIAYAVTQELMHKICDKSDCPELIAIGESQIKNFADYHPSKISQVMLVLDEPKSAGNMGMLIRSAMAFGADGLVISGHGADEYDPKCIRSSVGTFFSLPIYRTEGVTSFVKKLEQIKSHKSVKIIASGDKGNVNIQNMNLSEEVIFLVLGNETSGISHGYKQIADAFVKIPLQGEFTSLNIAAAGSIFLYEIFRPKA